MTGVGDPLHMITQKVYPSNQPKRVDVRQLTVENQNAHAIVVGDKVALKANETTDTENQIK